MDEPMFLCPHCEKSCARSTRSCEHCGLELDWLPQVPELREAFFIRGTDTDSLSTVTRLPAPIDPVLPHSAIRDIPLPTHWEQTLPLGRSLSSGTSCVLLDPGIEMVHCLLIWQPKTQQYWIADHRSRTGTFVNGRSIVLQPLQGGDLIQVGPYAWTFNAVDRKLVQVGPIDGVSVDVQKISVGRRLQHVSFGLHSGEFVAVIGPSGHGKSTLIRALIHDPGTHFQGEVLVDGRDVRKQIAWFRSRLGYVSQNAALYADLSAKNMMEFAAALRGAAVEAETQTLKEVDFSESRLQAGALCRELSGGESKRLRLAAELVAGPGLLVLEEPGRGLDEERETGMMRLMRQRARRGGTILMVTHNLQLLKYCDRVLVIKQDEGHVGRLFFDGPPQELLQRMPSGHFEDLKWNPDKDQPASPPEFSHSSPLPKVSSPPSAQPGCFRQLLLIMQRELALLCSSDLQTITRRLLIPLLLLPTFFAVAIGSSVPAVELEMLGFLSILACIWMGASLTLMAIVDEREAYNQERLLFLRIGPYVTAKMIVLGILAIAQCLLFFLLLWVLRTNLFDHDAMFHHPFGAVACLVPLSLAATGLGLVISALSGRSRPMANFILPLVMMAQIVFSVQIAVPGNNRLGVAYENFHLLSPSLMSGKGQEAPIPLAVVATSYLTLSRFGDIALRSFAYHKDNPPDHLQPRRNALAWLGTLVVLLPTAAAFTLWLQERPLKLPGCSDQSFPRSS